VRRLVLLIALVACSSSERARQPHKLATPIEARLPAAPGLRLPDDVTPLHYDLTLDVDPDRDTFSGEVRVRVRLARATDHVWIHADQIEIENARWDSGALVDLPVRGDQMRAFGFGRTLPPGDVELSFTYTGRTTGDQEGLFRQRAGDHRYLFSQGQAVFARRITPCFDEPRFKTPWRVTLVVPRQHVALANMPEEKQVADGDKKRITFAETPVMPSYLLAVAVGPFDLVDAGTVGARRIPVRVAVRAGAGKQVNVVASKLPAIVEAMEAYVGEPLPVRKIDLVGVPQFFGAMENPGLITFEDQILIGKDSKQRLGYFTHVAAHEIAHQWFGNSVTPAWWDDLWLSESSASWLGDKVTRQLGAFEDGSLQAVLSRREALEADTGPGALPLRRPIAGNADPDEGFDAIAYQKGQVVLATFEALVGEDAFRTAMREYLRAHRDATATMSDLVAALAQATKPDVGTAFEQYATSIGAPVIDLTLRCTGKPTLVAHARGGRLVPACIRYAGAKTPPCALVGDNTELALGSTCPTWVDGNAYAGYYTVHWSDRTRVPRPAQLEPSARVVAGDDLAAAFHRGELSAQDAMTALRTLLDGDGYAQLGGLALARQIDDIVDDAARPAWSAWLAPRVAKLRKNRKQPLANQLFRELSPLLLPADRASPDELRKANDLVDRLIAGDELPDAAALAVVAAKYGEPLFDRIVDKARATRDGDKRMQWLELLGTFPSTFAEPTAALAADKSELPIEAIWSALEEQLSRPTSRRAAWQALRSHLDTFTKRMPDRVTDFVKAAAGLCDRSSRDDVAKAFAGNVALGPTLAAIDQCVARRDSIGNLAAAIAGR
jgi:alanyl aminopeptidase